MFLKDIASHLKGVVHAFEWFDFGSSNGRFFAIMLTSLGGGESEVIKKVG